MFKVGSPNNDIKQFNEKNCLKNIPTLIRSIRIEWGKTLVVYKGLSIKKKTIDLYNIFINPKNYVTIKTIYLNPNHQTASSLSQGPKDLISLVH